MICTIASNGKEFAAGVLNENEEPVSSIKAALRNNIWKLFNKGYNEFYSNTEMGIPLWAGGVVTALAMYNDIEFNAVIPFEEQTTSWPEQQRDMYFSVHEKSETATLLNTGYEEGCYRQADEYMIDNSDALLYFGTAQDDCHILNYAKKQGLKIFIFNEENLEIE
jgi:uncharacterized phage-like protein YoqJ